MAIVWTDVTTFVTTLLNQAWVGDVALVGGVVGSVAVGVQMFLKTVIPY